LTSGGGAVWSVGWVEKEGKGDVDTSCRGGAKRHHHRRVPPPPGLIVWLNKPAVYL
jgi:hypothetical protein